jgi:hypothetical protein
MSDVHVENHDFADRDDPCFGKEIFRSVPARGDDVAMALSLQPGDDTRSEWRWFRTVDGTLILGFFPREEIYEMAVNGEHPIGI